MLVLVTRPFLEDKAAKSGVDLSAEMKCAMIAENPP